MFFKSQAHRARFLTVIQQFGHIESNGKLDPEYGAALYLLTSGLAIYEKASPYITHHGIQFDEMLSETDFSHGQEILVQLAGNLFNGGTQVSPVDFTILDTDNFAAVQESLRTRYIPPYLGEIAEAKK